MEDRAHALIAVSFLILLGLGAGFLAWWLQSGTPQVKIYDIVSPYSVSGLAVQAPVRYKGIKVGSVRHLGLDPHDPHEILIRVALVANAPVTHATYAQLSTEGITGMTYVALSDGDGQQTPLATSSQHPARIPIKPSLVHQLENSSKTLLSQGSQIGNRMNDLLDADNRTHIAAILAHLDNATAQLVALENAALPALQALPEIVAQAHQTLAQSRTLLQQLQQDAGTLGAVGQSTGAVAHRVRIDLLPRIDSLSHNLDRTLNHIDQLIQELRHNPQSVLFGAQGPKPGPGEPGFKTPRP